MTVSVFCCLHHQMLFTLGREILITLNPQNTIGWASQHNPYEQLDLPGFKKPFFFFFKMFALIACPVCFLFDSVSNPAAQLILNLSLSSCFFFFLFQLPDAVCRLLYDPWGVLGYVWWLVIPQAEGANELQGCLSRSVWQNLQSCQALSLNDLIKQSGKDEFTYS